MKWKKYIEFMPCLGEIFKIYQNINIQFMSNQWSYIFKAICPVYAWNVFGCSTTCITISLWQVIVFCEVYKVRKGQNVCLHGYIHK